MKSRTDYKSEYGPLQLDINPVKHSAIIMVRNLERCSNTSISQIDNHHIQYQSSPIPLLRLESDSALVA